MISRTLKLKPNAAQTARLDEWLMIATGVWNWALSQYVAHEQANTRYWRETPPPKWERGTKIPKALRNFPGAEPCFESLCLATRGHAARVGINAQSLQGILRTVCDSWAEYKAGRKGRPRRKGARNRLASIPVRQDIRLTDASHIKVPAFGVIKIRRHRDFPVGRIVCGRLQRMARGWYFTVVVDAAPKTIPLVGNEPVGVDMGYSTLATLSTGDKIAHPREYQRLERRLGQADRAHNRRLLGRLQQSIAQTRRKRNHAVSRDLVSRFGAIYVSRDNLRGLQRRFGKSVLSAGHGALLTMLETKCRQAGREYVEVPSRNSTRTCSSCGCLDGPTGLQGLKVREWDCGACGAHHDRDVNAAMNTLILGAVLAHERRGDPVSEISGHR